MEDQGHGLLEFGTSVSVNDELRRTLVAETEDLQHSIQTIKEAIGVETKVRQQLMKDQSHAATETQELHRGSKEVHERLAIMHQQVFHDLYHNTLKHELSMPPQTEQDEENTELSSPKDNDGSTTKDGGTDGDDANDVANDNASPQDNDKEKSRLVNPHSMRGIHQTHESLTRKFWKLTSYIQESEESMESFKSQQKESAAKKQDLAEKVAQLEEELAQTQRTTQTFFDNRQKEDDRRRALEAKLREMKAFYEKTVDDTDTKKQELETKMNDFLQQKEKLESEISKLDEHASNCAVALQVKTTEEQGLLHQQKQLDDEYTEYLAWKSMYEMQQAKREMERKERQALFSLQTDMESEWSTRKKHLHRLQNDASSMGLLVKKNDLEIAATEQRIQSTCEEIARMNKEVEELEALLAQDTDSDPIVDVLEQHQEKLKELQDECLIVEKQEKEVDDALEVQERLRAEEEQKHEKECDELRSEKEEVEQKILRVRSAIEEKKNQTESTAQLKRRYEVLKYGADVLALCKKKEQRYLQASKTKQEDRRGKADKKDKL